jgi:hypothetical protein
LEKSLAKWLKDHGIELLGLLLAAGSGVGAFLTGAGTMFTTFPLQALLLAIFAFMLGMLVFRFVWTSSRWARDRRTLEQLKGLQPQLHAAILRAYRDGCYSANYFLDPNVQYLLELGYLGAPSQIARLEATPFVLQQWFKNFLDRNYEKVYGSR